MTYKVNMKLTDLLFEAAVSQDQQQAAGAALAAKRGDIPVSALKGASKEMYKMSEKELEKFAGTKHKGLPVSIKESDFGYDNEAEMMQGELYRTSEYAKKLHDILVKLDQEGGANFPHWWQAKIVKAAEFMDAAYHYLEHELLMGKIHNTANVDDYGYEEYDDDEYEVFDDEDDEYIEEKKSKKSKW